VIQQQVETSLEPVHLEERLEKEMFNRGLAGLEVTAAVTEPVAGCAAFGEGGGDLIVDGAVLLDEAFVLPCSSNIDRSHEALERITR
jgi:hypothetical protein